MKEITKEQYQAAREVILRYENGNKYETYVSENGVIIKWHRVLDFVMFFSKEKYIGCQKDEPDKSTAYYALNGRKSNEVDLISGLRFLQANVD